MVLSRYFTDKELISNLRQYFSIDEQYTIDFKYWISHAKVTNKGFIIQVKSRRFLVHKMLGVVISEL